MSNPVHRSTTEGSITGQHKVPPLTASEETKHQPHCGSGVAAIKNVRRFLQTIKTNPLNGYNFTILNRRNRCPHRAQTGSSTNRILCWQEALNGGCALGNGTKKQSSMGNRFIAWNADMATEDATCLQIPWGAI